jgi:malate dehydrogenase (oxaloacetate-decarboxylating)
LPLLPGLRKAAIEIAIAAANQAQREGLIPAMSQESLRDAIVSSQWSPQYPSYL